MAKGRRLTTSRSERFLGSYGYDHQGQEGVNDAPELGEDDVWSMVDGMVNRDAQLMNGSHGAWSPSAGSESNGSLSSYRSHRHPSLADNQPHVGGLSLAFEDAGKTTSSHRIVHQLRGGQDGSISSPHGRQMATSAPVNVPDWSKIYRVDSVESLHDSDEGVDDQEDSEWVPPHEYLAREYARSRKMAANSVFEGVGRTLKGRDLSRVRDAVWSQTGFDG
ncbi:protein S40-6-like [Coffea arabica]|uniref:Protein S40-6-like n=1 Tax=Coffea arabica TaxID=13443 RepID=A0A6P6UE11_COFAR|nr:uncharacterized protein LOC113710321 [Coffea arabica]